MRRMIKALMALTPYRIVRSAQNRFDAIDSSLHLLKTLGYRPRLIVDGGAHLGVFSLGIAKLFPDAQIHMVEPQRSCHETLRRLEASHGFHLHSCALGSGLDVANGLKLAVGDEPSTGAHVAETGEPVEVSTLDQLLQPSPEDRTLLKLDLQGYELQALHGGTAMLEVAEVVLTEVSFFAQAYEPPIARLIAFLDANGFDLFDIAGLYGRRRDNRLRQGDFVFVKRGSPLAQDTRWS